MYGHEMFSHENDEKCIIMKCIVMEMMKMYSHKNDEKFIVMKCIVMRMNA